jgi:hypothetical protein
MLERSIFASLSCPGQPFLKGGIHAPKHFFVNPPLVRKLAAPPGMIPIFPFKLGNEFLHKRVLLVPEMLLAQVGGLLEAMFGSEAHMDMEMSIHSNDGMM